MTDTNKEKTGTLTDYLWFPFVVRKSKYIQVTYMMLFRSSVLEDLENRGRYYKCRLVVVLVVSFEHDIYIFFYSFYFFEKSWIILLYKNARGRSFEKTILSTFQTYPYYKIVIEKDINKIAGNIKEKVIIPIIAYYFSTPPKNWNVYDYVNSFEM